MACATRLAGLTAALLAACTLPAQGAMPAVGLTPSRAPTKGRMHGFVGDAWTLRVDVSEAEHLGFLPEGRQLSAGREEELRSETLASFRHLKDFARYRTAMLAWGYYTSGKGFQKVGMVCLLLERFLGTSDERTQECASWLAEGFKCFYDPAAESQRCRGASASYYDGDWGGIASRQGWDGGECNSDYGNTCYNDHHYHFGYFVVSAAILAKLQPACLQDRLFTDFVSTLIRDTTNPSPDDGYFPQFRAFDWFDLHSWSHGLSPMHDGKDQESTSEEINLLYGLHLWGRVTGNANLEQLGTTMLALASNTIREFFLMKNGNPHHPPEFVKNHVTGIFFQSKVDYTTWFGGRPEFIHGIQMLPLSTALQLTRKPDFCQEEWDDILGKVSLDSISKAWASIILTGGLAIIQPERAYRLLRAMGEGDMDNGLSRAWALYWTATEPGSAVARGPSPGAAAVGNRSTASSAPAEGRSSSRAASLLAPVAAGQPNAAMFPRRERHPVHRPVHSVVRGPKATNKFWANWVVEDGHNFPIFPMPYVLKWGPASGGGRELRVAHGSQPHLIYSSGRRSIKAYITHPAAEFALGAREQASDYTLVSEGLFGLHAELRGTAGQSVLFPVYSGMAYVSGRYSGGFTPTVSHFHGLASVKKARDGVWTFRNRRGASFRVYVLNSTSGFVDGSYGFDHRGNLNKPLDGWVRIAHVLKDGDTQVLDAHAPAVVIGCKLELEAGGTVRYVFEKEGPRDVEILHFAYGHHARMMLQEQEPAAPQEQAPSASERKNGPLLL